MSRTVHFTWKGVDMTGSVYSDSITKPYLDEIESMQIDTKELPDELQNFLYEKAFESLQDAALEAMP